MSAAIDEAATIVADVVPAARGAKWIAYAILGLVAALAIGFLIWWFFIHPRQLAQQAGQAKVDAKLGTATGNIATEAIPQINDATRQKVDVDISVQKGQIDVRAAPDAGTNIRGVSDGVLRNLCVQPAYAADPACVAVHEDPAGVGAIGPDPAGAGQPH
jgi:hypothetical protein